MLRRKIIKIICKMLEKVYDTKLFANTDVSTFKNDARDFIFCYMP